MVYFPYIITSSVKTYRIAKNYFQLQNPTHRERLSCRIRRASANLKKLLRQTFTKLLQIKQLLVVGGS
jgi:hypothetical protein